MNIHAKATAMDDQNHAKASRALAAFAELVALEVGVRLGEPELAAKIAMSGAIAAEAMLEFGATGVIRKLTRKES